MSEELLHFTRAGKVESIHRGDIVAVNVEGNLVGSIGDNSTRSMFWRSAAKPFQVLPFIERGGMEKYGITNEEVAFMVSSHNGEAEHVELTLRVLDKIGLTTAALACGAAKPMSGKAARMLEKQGKPFEAVHNACSGKHTGMLALAKMLNVPVEGYTEPEHDVQKLMLQTVADAAEMQPSEIDYGIDGCGVPVFWLPLHNMAYAYARLVKPEEGNWAEREWAVRIIRNAMLEHPHAVAGTGRLDTVLMQLTKGRILAKIGAEAVYCLASKSEGIGLVFKVDDGSFRAVNPVAIGALKHFGLITKDEHEELLKQFPPVLKNHRGDIIGTIETVF